jgi:glutamate synthase (NADPH/NADH) small chain
MGKPTGFIEFGRSLPRRRPVSVRLRDWREVYEPFSTEQTQEQGARCMDCGIPFCHDGCPLGNLIPEWNDLVYKDDWSDAIERLHATNNFPEFTGRLCPAPCEAACVLGINDDPVTIERIEYEIIERAWSEEWVNPQVPATRTGRSVAVVGSGPAGLAAAQQLARAGHNVTVFERAEKPGGLLRYGIPEFKMEKAVLDRRLAQMEAEGVTFVCATSVGGAAGGAEDGAAQDGAAQDGAVQDGAAHDGPLEPGEERGLGTACAPEVSVRSAADVRAAFDAVVLAGGATLPRDLPVPGRELSGVHLALEYLKPSNLVREGALSTSPINARGKRVVIIGGGDTGADCLGTAHRQGAASVHQFEILAEPPQARSDTNPWPLWPLILRTSSAHEEGGERVFSVTTTEFVDDGTGSVKGLRGHEVETLLEDGRPVFQKIVGSEFELECELVLLAMGFVGTERRGVVGELGVEVDGRGAVAADSEWATNVDGVFVCGDQTRGQSLIVWAIAEGRSAAAAVDRWLMGSTSLPSPIVPGQLALR